MIQEFFLVFYDFKCFTALLALCFNSPSKCQYVSSSVHILVQTPLKRAHVILECSQLQFIQLLLIIQTYAYNIIEVLLWFHRGSYRIMVYGWSIKS